MANHLPGIYEPSLPHSDGLCSSPSLADKLPRLKQTHMTEINSAGLLLTCTDKFFVTTTDAWEKTKSLG